MKEDILDVSVRVVFVVRKFEFYSCYTLVPVNIILKAFMYDSL